MSLNSAKKKLAIKIAEYVRDGPKNDIIKFNERKTTYKPNTNKPIQQAPQQQHMQTHKNESTQQIEDININTLEDFKYKQSIDDWHQEYEQALINKQLMFHQQYGYCLESSKYEQLMDRLLIVRKSLYKKVYGVLNLEECEQFIPQKSLCEIAKQLPTENFEIQGCSDKIHQFLDIVYKEIKYFIKQNNIDKSAIYYHPKMFHKSKMDVLEELLQEFQEETASKRKDSPIEPIIHKQFKV